MNMLNTPEIEKRKKEDFLQAVREIVPCFTPEWDAARESGAAAALLQAFAGLAETVAQRLNRVPDKHFMAFLDMLGMKLLPPQPARVPLTFILSEGTGQNVLIPERTQVAADEVIFETEKTLVATPAKVVNLYWVSNDQIFAAPPHVITGPAPLPFSSVLASPAAAGDHHLFLDSATGLDQGDLLRIGVGRATEYAVVREVTGTRVTLSDGLAGGQAGRAPVERGTVFALGRGKNLQARALYLGHRRLFDLQGPARITIGNLGALANAVWEYGGPDGADGIRWLPLEVLSRNNQVLLIKGEGAVQELDLWGIKSRWVRCRLPVREPVRGVDIDTGGLRVGISPVSVSVKQVHGIGIKFYHKLTGETPKIQTVNELLRLSPEKLAARLGCGRTRAVNILEAARKAFYDKTGSLGPAPSSQPPDLVFYNDVPLDFSSGVPVHPFGQIPRLYDTFYIACREAFSKQGARVVLEFTGSMAAGGVPAPEPVLSWEYWDGKGWASLPGVNETLQFKSASTVVTINHWPAVAFTEVNGYNNLWLRVRLVGGHYGQEVCLRGTQVSTGKVTPPRLSGLTISYEYAEPQPPEHCLFYGNREVLDLTGRKTGALEPLLSRPERALYLGFDRKVEQGPVSIFFDVQEQERAREGVLAWEYCSAAAGRPRWQALPVSDGTNTLTRSGTVEFVFPDDLVRCRRLGHELYWIRALDQDDLLADAVIKGVHPNTGWALQAESILGEIIGSSSGEADQKFYFSRSPVLTAEIWINELATLSEGERARMVREGAPLTEIVRDEVGRDMAFWVKWTPVADLSAGSESDRHFELDGAAGCVRFGDGRRGRIPPAGRDNIRATYRTGGGAQGNVGVAAVNVLKSSIAFVDKVVNPLPANGGCGQETVESVLERGVRGLRTRNRAITAADYEHLAQEASRDVARAKCFPNVNSRLEYEPGWVTVVIVPASAADKAMPSLELRKQVEKRLRQRSAAPVTVSNRMHVTGPLYVEVTVEATVVAAGVEEVPGVEMATAAKLREFLHPLKGGPEGRGWEFGRRPEVSDFYALLESLKGVDHVRSLTLLVAEVPPYGIISGGAHRIRVVAAERMK